MTGQFLPFEEPLAELEAKIQELRSVDGENALDLADEISRLEVKLKEKTKSIFSNLTEWQVALLARHPNRPYTLDYIKLAFTDFQELHGDRHFGDDQAIVGGLARLDDRPVVIIGHQKGRDTKQKVARNFGMPRPEGYRKALRLMQLAERFALPIITMIDTPGAYPGVGAEERNQSEAIARNLFEMSRLRAPIIATVIGEGGSGGALAIGVSDRTLMLQYGTYSVISPEGCASILWKDADHAEDAAKALKITSKQLLKYGLIDRVIDEPLGGAHRDIGAIASSLKAALVEELDKVVDRDLDELVAARYERLMAYGKFRS